MPSGGQPATPGCTYDRASGRTVCALENPLRGNEKDLRVIIGKVLKAAIGIIGSLTLLMMVWGGWQWLTSAGNPEKVKKGTQTMVWAAIGVILVFSSYLILDAVFKTLTGQGP